ncbi:MAG TPA: cytochrome c biogenesis protein CcdA [Candidatus Acidoferrales bacterium]|nr:cytochrome c biogenesis protein CcdA [Candidatus Acidoferrales bacterium]
MQTEMEITYLGAFVAGLISFLSPCVLPLVPGYISMLSGIGVDRLRKGEGAQSTLLWSALCFVVGFSAVFVSLGAGATTVGEFLRANRGALAPVAGAVIVLFGLHLVGVLVKIPVRMGLIAGCVLVALGFVMMKLWPYTREGLRPIQIFSLSLIFLAGPYLSGWLTRDVHLRNVGGQPGMVGAFLLGFAFAFGWTPCIGPILGTVLVIAGAQETKMQGVLLLLAYSAGLAIPFLVTALGVSQFMDFYQRFRKHLHAVEVLSGVLLLVVGSLIFTNHFTWLSGKLGFLQQFAR